MFKDLDDCLLKIIHYKDGFDESRRIAEKAHARVMLEHTYVHRAKKMVDALMERKCCL
jgi:spore maturation protein CgeB